MKITDLVGRPTGRLVYDVLRRGRVIEHVEDNNLIVDGTRQMLAHLLAGDVATRSVTTFAVGTSGTAPAAGNTAITGAYTNALVGIPTYPSATQVAFAFALGTTEANGMAILEFGLLTAGGVLIARKVRASALNKASDISFAGSWTLSF